MQNFLESRRGLLDAVVFSGGEPTSQHHLHGAMQSVRKLGFRIGLHTAGIFPSRLRRVLPLADWVGLDIKAPLDQRYDAITQIPQSAIRVIESLRAVMDSGAAYELRTTVHPLLIDTVAKRAIERAIADMGGRPTRWQPYRQEGCADAELREFPG